MSAKHTSHSQHKQAREHDIPKHLRSYAKRYGGLHVMDIVQIQKRAEARKK